MSDREMGAVAVMAEMVKDVIDKYRCVEWPRTLFFYQITHDNINSK